MKNLLIVGLVALLSLGLYIDAKDLKARIAEIKELRAEVAELKTLRAESISAKTLTVESLFIRKEGGESSVNFGPTSVTFKEADAFLVLSPDGITWINRERGELKRIDVSSRLATITVDGPSGRTVLSSKGLTSSGAGR